MHGDVTAGVRFLLVVFVIHGHACTHMVATLVNLKVASIVTLQRW